jgi:signal transduction histidine kinase
MLERTFQEITHPDDLDTDLEQLHRLVRGEIETYSMEKRYIRREGSHVWVNLTVSLLRNKPGEPEWVVSVVQDITDSKRAQAAAFERQKLESVGTLANGIAHDFNNLLHGVMALTELALANLADGLGPEAELKRIRDVAIHGSDIVRELMIYTRQENAVLDTVDVSRIVEAIIDLLRVSVSKHASLEVNLEKDLPPVRASAGQLRLIVLNLVTNASDAIGDRDGVIRVTTGFVTVVQDGSWITSEGLVAGDYLQLEVSDTGCGMPLETQANMFDPFFTTKSVGRGLGLAVVQGIVRSLHGAIRLKSAPGKGATFQILLPYTETAAATAGGPIGAGAR